MIEATITVVGNVATEPTLGETTNGTAYTHFRMAANGSRFDKRSRQWRNDDTSFYTVYCWRAPLADNVDASLTVGDPVFVHGRMRVKEWTDENDIRHWLAEIDARSLGHDLFRCTSERKDPKDRSALAEEDKAIEDVRNTYLGNSPPATVNTLTGEVTANGADESGDSASAAPAAVGALA